MDRKKSTVLVFILVLILVGQITLATNPNDVNAINSLYVSLGSPALPGWTGSAGDPCADGWLGVRCDDSRTNIVSIVVRSANLVGELGHSLGSFTSLTYMDLSNNHIGGSIPPEFPITIRSIILANNSLSGTIPSYFPSLSHMENFDLSHNYLSGELPSSLQSLSSLCFLNLQNNQLSGTLDVLQELPLQYLLVENNSFTGSIPEKLLFIPVFRFDGNLFDTTIPPPLSGTPLTPAGPGTPFFPAKPKNNWTTKQKIWVSVMSVSGLVMALMFLLFKARRQLPNFLCFKAPPRVVVTPTSPPPPASLLPQPPPLRPPTPTQTPSTMSIDIPIDIPIDVNSLRPPTPRPSAPPIPSGLNMDH